MAFSGAHAVFYALYDALLFYREILVLVGTIVAFSTVFLATRAGRVERAMWLLIVTTLLQLGVVNWLLGPEAGA